jgi:2,5-diamino-6-(ribosylamino)-4(3H)-pyrimidinone 5'-phosphate reductase
MRPHIICHMITSLDGKIAFDTSYNGISFEDAIPGFDIYYDLEEVLGGQAWMCGRTTFEHFSSKTPEQLPETIGIDLPINLIATPVYSGEYCVVVDTQGKLRWNDNTVLGKYKIIYVVTTKTPKAFLQYLINKNISYITAGEVEVDFKILFENLFSLFGISKLRLEGGGKINGSVYKAGLIDEISLVISPLVVNNPKAPSVFEDANVDIHTVSTQFELLSAEKLENNLVWLRYKKL